MKRRYLIALTILLTLGLITLFIPETHDESLTPRNQSISTNQETSTTQLPAETDSLRQDPQHETTQPDSEDQASTVALYGRVSNPAGGRISNARLELDGSVRASSVSDDNGDFRLSELPPGSYQITIEHDRYESVSKRIRIRKDQQLPISLPWLEIRGSVTSQDIDKPIEQFNIFWSNVDRPNDTGDRKQRFIGTNGAFTLEYEHHQYDALRIVANGYEIKLVPISSFTREENGLTGDFQLVPRAGIIGRVVNEQHEPIAGARIFRSKSRNDPNQADDSVATLSAVDGRFRIGDFDISPMYFVTTHPDYASGFTILDKRNTLIEDNTIVLNPGTTLSGRVTYDTKPVSKAYIQVYAEDEEAFEKWSIKTRADGSYIFPHLPPGQYIVDCLVHGTSEDIKLTNGATLRENITIEPNEPNTVDFEILISTGRLEANIVGVGEKRLISVIAESNGFGPLTRQEATRNDIDAYSFESIPAGEWNLLAIVLSINSIGIERRRVIVYPNEVTLYDVRLLQQEGGIHGTIHQTGTSALLLFRGTLHTTADKFFNTLRGMMELEELPGDLEAAYFTELGDTSAHQPNRPFAFENLKDGDYTLLGSLNFEEQILLNIETTPYIQQHISIENGSSIELEIDF